MGKRSLSRLKWGKKIIKNVYHLPNGGIYLPWAILYGLEMEWGARRKEERSSPTKFKVRLMTKQ
jgi:hypothetical protein